MPDIAATAPRTPVDLRRSPASGGPSDFAARLERAYARADAADAAARRAAERAGTTLHPDDTRVTWAELAQSLHDVTGVVYTTDLEALARMAARDVGPRLAALGEDGSGRISVTSDGGGVRVEGLSAAARVRLLADPTLFTDIRDAFGLRESAEIQRIASDYVATWQQVHASRGAAAAAQVTGAYSDMLRFGLTMTLGHDGATFRVDQRI